MGGSSAELELVETLGGDSLPFPHSELEARLPKCQGKTEYILDKGRGSPLLPQGMEEQ